MEKKRTLITIAIALVLAFFVGYGIEVFDPSPRYDFFCPPLLYEITNQTQCEAASGAWNPPFEKQTTPKPIANNFCQPKPSCHQDFEKIMAKHNKIVFIIAVIVGLIAIIGGVLLIKEIISTGFVGGGILIILYGTLRYWRYAEDVLKFVLLGIALGILIWIAYKKLEPK